MLSIIGLVAIFVFAYQAFKTANSNGRNGVLWGLAVLAAGFGFQWIVPIAIGTILAIVYLSSGTSPNDLQSSIQGYAAVIGFVCLFLSIISMWLIMKHVSKVPDDAPNLAAPPPPPTFGDNDPVH